MEKVAINPTIELSELIQDWGNRLLEGTNKSLCTLGPRRREQTPQETDPDLPVCVQEPVAQEKTLPMDITRWSIPKSDLLYSLQSKMEMLYTVSKNKTGSCLWLRSWTPYCQIRLKLKDIEKTTRPFSYDLNQIPYDYTVEATNRFKGIDLIVFLKKYGLRFITLYRRRWQEHLQEK